MKSLKYRLVFSLIVCLSVSVLAMAQDTKTKVVQNPDGSYTVIEYPVGKEVIVNLVPGATVVGSRGTVRVMRASDGTKVAFDVSGIPAGTTNLYAYAIDPTGSPTLLGPLTVADGIAKAEFSTPLNQFMIALSPTEGLTTWDANTTWVYRSDVPAGFAVVPRTTGPTRVVAVQDTTVAAAYEVPLLNVPSFGDKEKEVKLKFGGELEGLEAKAYVDREKGTTKVKMTFDDMKKVPAAKRFTLWAYSADGKYTKLGQVINSGKRDEARIATETALTDFGLFLTVEDADVLVPTSRIYSVFTVPTVITNP